MRFTLADKNDSEAVFTLSRFAAEHGLLTGYMEREVQQLWECELAKASRPRDTGSHPYDGAAEDVFWFLADELDISGDADVNWPGDNKSVEVVPTKK